MQTDSENKLSLIPGVDRLLVHPLLIDTPAALRLEACRAAVRALREAIQDFDGRVPDRETLLRYAAEFAAEWIKEKRKTSLKPVINCTGTILHTNLGRAVLSDQALRAVFEIGGSYSNLEYDLETGRRGSRQDHIRRLLQYLTGAEDTLVVNNNAAAIFLTLVTLASGKEVILSRGQLVEIGDTFRIPEILALSGAVLREVGTTNRTYLSDYESAINENTALLVYVHTSNFSMDGFTKETSIEELCTLGQKYHIPVVADLGSGCLYRFPEEGLINERIVSDTLREGCSLVTFSGDKLLGGPQAGIIAGDEVMIDKIRKHPFHRTVRIDKLALSALEATLAEYLDPDSARREIPTLSALTADIAILQARADALHKSIALLPGISAEVQKGYSQAGGGSMPNYKLETRLVAISHAELSLSKLTQKLRTGVPPILTFIQNNQILFDVRTIRDHEIPLIAKALDDAVLSDEVI